MPRLAFPVTWLELRSCDAKNKGKRRYLTSITGQEPRLKRDDEPLAATALIQPEGNL